MFLRCKNSRLEVYTDVHFRTGYFQKRWKGRSGTNAGGSKQLQGGIYMVEHKAWDWEKIETDIWYRPAEIAYYLAERWKQKGYSHFLDLGCGLGRHSLFFARKGFTVHSIDLSESAVEGLRATASEQNLPITAQCGDMSALPYQDDAFDCLLAYHVISHTDTAGIKKILSEIRRVVKNGGEVYLTLCSKNAWSYKEAGFPVVDENTVIKVEDGPENGIPHFFTDAETIGISLYWGKINIFNAQSLSYRADVEYGNRHCT